MTNNIEIYVSPFDLMEKIGGKSLFFDKYSNFHSKVMVYDETLETLLEDLIEFTDPTNPISKSSNIYDISNFTFMVPRLIRGIADNRERLDDICFIPLLESSTQLLLNSYKDGFIDEYHLDDLKFYISKFGLLNKKVEQKEDFESFVSYAPFFSKENTKKLVKKFNGENLLFIALGHGGVPAGADVYLRYISETNNLDSKFHTTRFSMKKKGDLSPDSRFCEINYLREFKENNHLVLFDEDKATGKTMEVAYDNFKKSFPNNNIFQVINLNISKLNDYLDKP